MDHVNFFKDFFESIPDYRKIVLILFLTKIDVYFLNGCGFYKNDLFRV